VKTETDRSALASPEPDKGSGAKRSNPILRFLGEMPGLIIMSLVLAILIKTFLIQAFYIPSGSMENTLQINDRVLVSKIPYYFHDPKRGDVIVFSEPDPGKAVQRGAVEEVATVGGRARIRLRTMPPLVAELTTGSVDRLGITPGHEIWASCKAVEIRLMVPGDEPDTL